VTAVLPTVRRARANDLDQLVVLHRRFCAADGHPFEARRAQRAFTPLLDDDERGVVLLVETTAGAPSHPAAHTAAHTAARGYAVLTWGWSIEAGGAEGLLDEIFVDEPGRGTGSLLLRHVVDHGARRGVTRIVLETERSNERGRALYARHGFVADDSIWMSLDLTERP